MKYLFLSDSPFLGTGFRNQSFLLAEKLVQDNHEVFWIAPTHVGTPIKNAVLPDGRKCEFTVLPGGRHPHAADTLPVAFAATRPHVFYCLLDSFMLFPQDPNINILAQNWTAPSTLWFPSDGGYFPWQCELVLKKFTHPVAMSKWGRDQVKQQFNLDVEYIPHGCKTNQFYPFSNEQKASLRNQYGQRLRRNLHGKFIVGCVARNQPRKFMDRLIKAFTLFAQNKNDVVLLLHSDPRDPAQPFPITELIKRARIEHKVDWTGMNALTGFTDAQMNEVYNLFDVKLDTTSGEGFGITIIEAMSAQVPVIITDYTTTKEIVTDHKAGLAIKLAGEDEPLYDGKAETGLTNQIVGGWGVERAVCDVKHAAQLLQQCYDDWTKGGIWLKEMGENGRRAVLKEYDWDTVVWPKWRAHFAKMMQ